MTNLYTMNSDIVPDDLDAKLLAEKEAAWNARAPNRPRVGDFVMIGTRTGRFSHDWNDTIQWSKGGSWYLHDHGYASFSGGLNPPIPVAGLTLTEEVRDGDFWFFHHDRAGAHRGVGCKMGCRVFRAETRMYRVMTDGEVYQVEAVDKSDAWSEAVRQERKRLGMTDYWYPSQVDVQETA